MFGSNVNTGLIGLPALPGDLLIVKSRGIDSKNCLLTTDSDSGYFLEAWAGLSLPITPWLQVGAFSKYSGVYGKTNGKTVVV